MESLAGCLHGTISYAQDANYPFFKNLKFFKVQSAHSNRWSNINTQGWEAEIPLHISISPNEILWTVEAHVLPQALCSALPSIMSYACKHSKHRERVAMPFAMGSAALSILALLSYRSFSLNVTAPIGIGSGWGLPSPVKTFLHLAHLWKRKRQTLFSSRVQKAWREGGWRRDRTAK